MGGRWQGPSREWVTGCSAGAQVAGSLAPLPERVLDASVLAKGHPPPFPVFLASMSYVLLECDFSASRRKRIYLSLWVVVHAHIT